MLAVEYDLVAAADQALVAVLDAAELPRTVSVAAEAGEHRVDLGVIAAEIQPEETPEAGLGRLFAAEKRLPRLVEVDLAAVQLVERLVEPHVETERQPRLRQDVRLDATAARRLHVFDFIVIIGGFRRRNRGKDRNR